MLGKKSFSDGAAVHFGWEKMKEHMGYFVLMFLVMIGACVALVALFGIIGSVISEDYWFITLIFPVAYLVLGTIMGIGFIKIMLDTADGKKPMLVTLFTEWDVFFKYLGVMIVYGVVVYVGLMLLVFPGVIWMLKFYMAPFLVVDKKMGPIEAMKKSSEMTMGLKWDLLGFHCVTGVLSFLGMICLYVGMIFTIPTAMIATAKVYREIS